VKIHEGRHLIYKKGCLGGERWVKGRKGKGEGLLRVLTMVKTAPLGIASRR